MILALVFAFGLIVGSFLNVVIYRLYSGEGMVAGRSHCRHCGHVLGIADLVPILSFAWLRGRCRYCERSVSWQYPLVESATAACFALAYWHWSAQADVDVMRLVLYWLSAAALIIIFVYDLKHYLILDQVTVPAAVAALGINLYLGHDWWRLLLAVAVAAGFFGLQYVISRGKWIGGGDIRLGAVMGLMLGWPNVLVALFLAYILGSVIAMGLILGGKKTMQSQVPFGTFLSAATFIALLYGSDILAWYLSFGL